MAVRNDLDRFHLAMDATTRVPGLECTGAHVQQAFAGRLIDHRRYIIEYGEDPPEIRDWTWPY